jgi:hypothetical protein
MPGYTAPSSSTGWSKRGTRCTLPASTASAATQVLAHLGSLSGKLGGLAVCARASYAAEQGRDIQTPAPAIAASRRKERRPRPETITAHSSNG